MPSYPLQYSVLRIYLFICLGIPKTHFLSLQPRKIVRFCLGALLLQAESWDTHGALLIQCLALKEHWTATVQCLNSFVSYTLSGFLDVWGGMVNLAPARKIQKLSIYQTFNSDYHSFHFHCIFSNISVNFRAFLMLVLFYDCSIYFPKHFMHIYFIWSMWCFQ